MDSSSANAECISLLRCCIVTLLIDHGTMSFLMFGLTTATQDEGEDEAEVCDLCFQKRSTIIPHVCLFLPPSHQTIWSTFWPCPRIWPILCTQFMTMARVVVGSGGSDILCC